MGRRQPKQRQDHRNAAEGPKKMVLQLYTPHDGQAQVHACTARFRAVVCGRRWGKSLLGVNELAAYSWEHPELPSWWVAPTYNQAAKGFTVCCDQLDAAIESRRQAPGQMSIVWKSGGRSRFVSTERYENLRGEGVGLMILDEAAFMPRSAWEQVLRPMLTDTMGRALFATTPKGKNWLYGIYKRGVEVDSDGNKVYPDYESFSFPTVTSPYIAESEVEEAHLTLPADVFNQEYLAEFLDEAAGVFYGIQDCIFGELYEPNAAGVATHGHRYVIGWDIAKHTDFSVITAIDLDTMRDGIPTPHVCYFERFNQLRYDLQMDRVAFVSAMYGGAPVLLDSTGIGDPIYDSLSSRMPPVPVFPYVLGNSASKVRLIQNLSVSIQSKAISYPKIPILISELESYQYTITPAGSFSYSAPEGEHDDTVISLALAAWIAQHQTWMPPARFVVEDNEIISPI